MSDIQLIINYEEVNDSSGTQWVNLTDLYEKNSSPLILKILDARENFEERWYKGWEILK